jgi:hypothetical protein
MIILPSRNNGKEIGQRTILVQRRGHPGPVYHNRRDEPGPRPAGIPLN